MNYKSVLILLLLSAALQSRAQACLLTAPVSESEVLCSEAFKHIDAWPDARPDAAYTSSVSAYTSSMSAYTSSVSAYASSVSADRSSMSADTSSVSANTSSGSANQTMVHDSIFVPQSEFRYADNPRVIFLGGTPRRVTEIQPLPTIGLALGYSALVVGLHINQANAWWSNDRGPFHFVEDIQYAKGLDKLGHFYSAYIMSRLSGDLLMECGLSQDAGTAIGAAMGLAYVTYVEVEDGFAKQWGFSPTDAVGNVFGTAFYVGQQYVPFLQNFHPRSSYIPAEWVGNRPINERPTTFIDDYNSLTFWLSMNANNLMPKSWAEYWPDWLMITVGYGINNYGIIRTDGSTEPVHGKFLIGLDYDLVKIIPRSKIGFINYLIQGLNIIRLPGPTLEFTHEGTRFGFFYPFAMTVHF